MWLVLEPRTAMPGMSIVRRHGNPGIPLCERGLGRHGASRMDCHGRTELHDVAMLLAADRQGLRMSDPLPADGRVGSQAALALLVVDDEVHVAGELADAALDEGYVVHVANSVTSALEAIGRHPEISVMVSDIRMPDGNGLELTKQVLAMRAETEAVEVILMTGHATLTDAITAVRTGAFDFIRKPFRLQEILEAVSRARARSIGRRRIAQTQRTPVLPVGTATKTSEDPRQWPADAVLNGLMYELRTPLVPVLGFAEILEASLYPAATREYARQIGASAKLLLTTVEDLITLAQIDRGLVQLTIQEIDAQRLLRQAVERHGADADLHGVSLNVTNAHADLQADPVLVARALDILLRVAMQHAVRGGSVALSVTQPGAGSAITIDVEATAASHLCGEALLDGMQTAMQIAPLGTRLADAVARLHEGALVIPRSPAAIFCARLILPGIAPCEPT